MTPRSRGSNESASPGSPSYRDGTMHVIFEPLDFIARLAALVSQPRVNLTRFHGVFAPNSKYREPITGAATEWPLRGTFGVHRAKVLSSAVCW